MGQCLSCNRRVQLRSEHCPHCGANPRRPAPSAEILRAEPRSVSPTHSPPRARVTDGPLSRERTVPRVNISSVSHRRVSTTDEHGTRSHSLEMRAQLTLIGDAPCKITLRFTIKYNGQTLADIDAVCTTLPRSDYAVEVSYPLGHEYSRQPFTVTASLVSVRVAP